MGLIVDASDTPHDVEFEVRRESVVFWDIDGERVELTKAFLKKLRNLLNDPEWKTRLTEQES